MLKTLIHACQDLVFPSYCLQCEQRLTGNDPPLLCSSCFPDVTFINPPICICCGAPFETGKNHLCGLCLQKKYYFDLARSAVKYREPISSLISSLKFNGTLTGLPTLAHLAFNSPGFKELASPDIILPVPLFIKRLRHRKFNQALLICRTCFPEEKKKIQPDILIRHRLTFPQTGLRGKDRRKNLAGAFSVTDKEKIDGKNVLLIDDVFTTGSTVNECAKVLSKAGAKRIEVFTLARAL